MSSHTPGPWRTEGGCLSHRVEIWTNTGWQVGTWDDETHNICSNARLIAAAPDLLAACEALVDACDNGSRSAIECAEIARAAIAKAKGEAQ